MSPIPETPDHASLPTLNESEQKIQNYLDKEYYDQFVVSYMSANKDKFPLLKKNAQRPYQVSESGKDILVWDVIKKEIAKNSDLCPYLKQTLPYVGFQESRGFLNLNSSAGAVGSWQFLASTARRYGVRVGMYKGKNGKKVYIDERNNIAIATRGAARYFAKIQKDIENHQSFMDIKDKVFEFFKQKNRSLKPDVYDKMFQDHVLGPLTINAYICGEGHISNALSHMLDDRKTVTRYLTKYSMRGIHARISQQYRLHSKDWQSGFKGKYGKHSSQYVQKIESFRFIDLLKSKDLDLSDLGLLMNQKKPTNIDQDESKVVSSDSAQVVIDDESLSDTVVSPQIPTFSEPNRSESAYTIASKNIAYALSSSKIYQEKLKQKGFTLSQGTTYHSLLVSGEVDNYALAQYYADISYDLYLSKGKKEYLEIAGYLYQKAITLIDQGGVGTTKQTERQLYCDKKINIVAGELQTKGMLYYKN